MNYFYELFQVEKPVFGMIHLAALPGSPRYAGSIAQIVDRAAQDAKKLQEAGVDALVVENFNDDPFFTETVAPETVATMAVISKIISDLTNLPLGINVLRNSWNAAMGIAVAVNAQFIRINVLTDAMITDQGIIQGCSANLLRYRQAIGAQSIKVFADVESKHAVPMAIRPRTVVANDMVERGGADGIIVSGDTSANPPNIEHIKELREAVPHTPIIIGSGMTISTVEMLAYADATIFGFGAKANLKDPVDRSMALAFMDAVRSLRLRTKRES